MSGVSKERVRVVVRASALALLTERNLYIVKPQPPTIGEMALEAYGHGRACDAAALLGDELHAILDAIASRVAEQLTPSEVQPCDISTLSSRACERGTKACVTEHGPAALSDHDCEVIGWVIEDAPPVHRGDLIRRTMERVLAFRPALATPVSHAADCRYMPMIRPCSCEGALSVPVGLDSEDREALRWARRFIEYRTEYHDSQAGRAMGLIDRLLGGKP